LTGKPKPGAPQSQQTTPSPSTWPLAERSA